MIAGPNTEPNAIATVSSVPVRILNCDPSVASWRCSSSAAVPPASSSRSLKSRSLSSPWTSSEASVGPARVPKMTARSPAFAWAFSRSAMMSIISRSWPPGARTETPRSLRRSAICLVGLTSRANATLSAVPPSSALKPESASADSTATVVSNSWPTVFASGPALRKACPSSDAV